MLRSICVFLKKNNRKAAKLKFPCWTITFPDQIPPWKIRDSAEPQTLCNSSQLWVLCSKPLGLLMEIIVTELLFKEKPDVKEKDMLCVILCCFFSSTLACLFCCISLFQLVKAVLLTASLVSCSYAYLKTAFKHPLTPPNSLPLTM